ncbi:MAG: omptin family outer membrane protease [Treponema sp.]|nr:omptin family outer membrane protease [Candidatus Treponema equifaecale]
MKKIFSVLFVVFQFSFFAFSHDFHLSVEPLVGLKNGQVDEYVFLKKCDYSDDKLSELNWDVKNEFYLGGKIETGYKKLFADFKFTAAIPKSSGQMDDSDWLNVEKSGTEAYQYKTNYSISDNFLKYDFLFGVDLGYDFDIFKNEILKIRLRPLIAFNYEKFYFNARNGSAWYGSYSGNHYLPYESATTPTYSFSGKSVIDYIRQSYTPWFGMNSYFTFKDKIDVGLGFRISPYTYVESIDIHYLNNGEDGSAYLDATPGYFKTIKCSAEASYRINSRNSINFSANWVCMNILRGDDYEQTYKSYKKTKKFDPAKTKNSTVDGGAAEHYFDFSLSYKFKIF